MDALSFGLLAIGVLAAIGAMFVAMSERETEVAKPESTVKVAAASPEVATPPDLVTTMSGRLENDPVFVWLGKQVQLLTEDMQKLRRQEAEVERRLKLLSGIAFVMHEAETSTEDESNHVAARTNSAGANTEDEPSHFGGRTYSAGPRPSPTARSRRQA